jgi:hypothetical protein
MKIKRDNHTIFDFNNRIGIEFYVNGLRCRVFPMENERETEPLLVIDTSLSETNSQQTDSFKDWIPAIIVALLFLALSGYIFGNIGIDKEQDSSIIASKVIPFKPTLTGIQVHCIGAKQCSLMVEKDRKYPNDITLSYWIESNEARGMRFIHFSAIEKEDQLVILVNSTNFPLEKSLTIHLNVFLPVVITQEINIKYEADVASLNILGIPSLFGTIYTTFGTGSANFVVHLSII